VLLFEGKDTDAGRPSRTVRNARMNARIASALAACVPFLIVTLLYAFARIHALGDHAFGIPHPIDAATMHGVVGAAPLRGPAQIAMTLPMVVLTYIAVLAFPGMADPVHSTEWITHLQPIVFISWASLISARGNRAGARVAQPPA